MYQKAKKWLDGGLEEMQWRRRDFFGGRALQPLKGYHAPRRGSVWRRTPDGSEVSFLKTIPSIS